MATEPAYQQRPSSAPEGRWRWWYAAIADWMLRNPDGTQDECAKHFGKHPNTISRIVTSDTYRAYLAQRRREWQADHDAKITQRLGDVALKSMDNILDQLDKKRDTLKLDILTELMGSSLEALGFGKPAAPTVQVNTQVDASSQTVVLPGSVSAAALVEAREALRLAEARRIQDVDVLPPPVAATTFRGAGSLEVEDAKTVLEIEKDESSWS